MITVGIGIGTFILLLMIYDKVASINIRNHKNDFTIAPYIDILTQLCYDAMML